MAMMTFMPPSTRATVKGLMPRSHAETDKNYCKRMVLAPISARCIDLCDRSATPSQ